MSRMRFFALQELSNRKPLEVIAPSNKLSDYYGSHVFDRKKMQEYLPKEILGERLWKGQENPAEHKLIEQMRRLWGDRF